MNSTTQLGRDTLAPISGSTGPYTTDPYVTHVAWGAIIGGAAAAASLSLILLILGSALGLSSVSPWSSTQSVAHFTVKMAIWLIIMQWIASGFGGYLTGRLRHKWAVLHKEEVFFRDTAHGFLTWALATLLTASILTGAASSIIGTGVQATATVAAGASAGAAATADNDANGYYIDSLFRPTAATQVNDTHDVRAETARILATDLKNGSVTENDKAYLAQIVSSHTGLTQPEATQRVNDTLAQIDTAKEKAKEAAEAARKTAMHVSIYLFLSLLIGAFIASAASALGGRHRDEY